MTNLNGEVALPNYSPLLENDGTDPGGRDSVQAQRQGHEEHPRLGDLVKALDAIQSSLKKPPGGAI